MNKRIKRWGTALMLCLFLSVSNGVTAYAQVDEAAVKREEEAEKQEKKKEKEKEKDDASLTPDGNLTLIDDLDEEQGSSLQFMTVQSKSGNYFYIIVDRNSQEDNVYFLNMVDEADLLCLIPEEERSACGHGSCCDCGQNAAEPAPSMEPAPEPTIEPAPSATPEVLQPQTQKKDSKAFLYLLILLLGGGAVAAYYFLKIRPGRADAGLGEDMEFYDDEEYENEDAEPEFAEDGDDDPDDDGPDDDPDGGEDGPEGEDDGEEPCGYGPYGEENSQDEEEAGTDARMEDGGGEDNGPDDGETSEDTGSSRDHGDAGEDTVENRQDTGLAEDTELPAAPLYEEEDEMMFLHTDPALWDAVEDGAETDDDPDIEYLDVEGSPSYNDRMMRFLKELEEEESPAGGRKTDKGRSGF